MGESCHLRLSDVRAVFRLVGECRDVWADPARWGRHLLAGLGRLTGVRVGIGGELRTPGTDGAGELVTLIDTGLGPVGRAVLADFLRLPKFGSHPVLRAVFDGWTGRVAARTRRQLVADRDWYGSSHYNLYHRPIGTDHALISPLRLPDGTINMITLHRVAGERDFSPRERRLLLLAHDEVGRLIGPVLVSAADPYGPTRLPPRVRETLHCLLEGDSEKQAAARMGLSVPTVHQYVTALYRHYRVASRAELLARVLRRSSSPAS